MYKRTLNAIIGGGIPEKTCMCKAQFGNAMYSSDIAFAITTRIDASGAYCIIEKEEMENNEISTNEKICEKIKKPKELDNVSEVYKSHTLNEILPYLPSEDCFFDSRHWTYGTDVLPFSVTTRIDSNNQQFLKISEPLALGYSRDKKGNVTNHHLNNVVNTLHSSTGSGGNTDCFVAEPVNGSLSIPQATSKGYAEVQIGGVFDGSYPNSKTRRGRVQENGTICPTLTAGGEPPMRFEGVEYKGKIIHEGDGLYTGTSEKFVRGGLNGVSRTLKSGMHDAGVCDNYRIRKLTERECFRLMGVSEESIDKIQGAGISKTQQYKMAGNSIVVDVLFNIFRKMFIEKENDSGQLTLFDYG